MANKDFSKLRLTETGLYGAASYHKFYGAFKKYNIVFVSQVLDDNLMHEVEIHLQAGARVELRGFISLLKHKYLGVPLCSSNLLETKASVGEHDKDYFNADWTRKIEHYYPGYDNGKNRYSYRVNLGNFGLTKKDQRLIYWLVDSKKEAIEKIPLIDIFKEVLSLPSCNAVCREILEMHIKSYESDRTISSDSVEPILDDPKYLQELSKLRGGVSQLEQLRASIDGQIEELNRQIELLPQKYSKGGKK